MPAPLTADLETALANLPKADKAPLPEIVAELKDWIAPGLTAMASDVNETRYVRSWIEGHPFGVPRPCEPPGVQHIIDGPEMAKAWMMGQPPAFDFRAPVRELRENNDDESRSAVVRAAVQFASA